MPNAWIKSIGGAAVGACVLFKCFIAPAVAPHRSTACMYTYIVTTSLHA